MHMRDADVTGQAPALRPSSNLHDIHADTTARSARSAPPSYLHVRTRDVVGRMLHVNISATAALRGLAHPTAGRSPPGAGARRRPPAGAGGGPSPTGSPARRRPPA